jgi:hypothetical protein
MLLIAYTLGLIFGFNLGWCCRDVPKFKTDAFVQSRREPWKSGHIHHIKWSIFHKQWTYYCLGYTWDGYYLAKDLRKI